MPGRYHTAMSGWYATQNTLYTSEQENPETAGRRGQTGPAISGKIKYTFESVDSLKLILPDFEVTEVLNFRSWQTEVYKHYYLHSLTLSNTSGREQIVPHRKHSCQICGGIVFSQATRSAAPHYSTMVRSSTFAASLGCGSSGRSKAKSFSTNGACSMDSPLSAALIVGSNMGSRLFISCSTRSILP